MCFGNLVCIGNRTSPGPLRTSAALRFRRSNRARIKSTRRLTMITNATVAGVTAAAQGHVLKVTYKGGEAEVIVAPDTPIVTMLQVMPPC